MASTTTTRLGFPSDTSIDWAGASSRAQDRIIRLQEQRAREATSISRFTSFFTGSSDLASRPTFRVNQLDTELLDEELLGLLKGQLWNGLKYFRPSIKETFEPELMLLLRAALFKLSIWDNNTSYGAALQNLRYTDARKPGPVILPPSKGQKSLYGLFTVGGRYLHQRLNLFLLSRSAHADPTPFTTKLSRLLDIVGTVHSALTLISFTAFLVTGHYRTLLDRVLRMRLVSPNPALSRDVSFEYLNRQLVWHAFTEFLLFILPLLRIGRWRRWWARFLRNMKSEGGAAGETIGELTFLPERTCAICYKETDAASAGAALGGGRATDITNPYEAVECGHVYCYVCLASKIELEEGEGWTCLRCGGVIKRCRPWRGGVKGLTGVGDWGEEVYGQRKADFDGDSEGSVNSSMLKTDLLDELQDGDVEDGESELDDIEPRYDDDNNSDFGGGAIPAIDVEAESSDAGSEDTVQPKQNGHLGPEDNRWSVDYADDSVFDDSQYNTAEDYD